MKQKKILIIDDEQSLLESLEMYFSEKGYEVSCASNGSEGLEKNDAFDPDLIILDVRLPDMDGLDILKEMKRRNRMKSTIIITAFHEMETTIKAIKLGAYEYIPKPLDIEELEKAVKRGLRLSTTSNSAKSLSIGPSADYAPGKIVGQSKVMKEIFKAIGMHSENRVTLLIEGETGTGKELIARAIHRHSPFKDQPFLAINCSTIVGTLLESELFGHEKGAFTGAIFTKRGKFELAGDGTIFLDEVSEFPFELQAKLLRFLQEKEFDRVGSEKSFKSNARVIAASNKELWQMVRAGTFREDLYYRLSVAAIKVPPLRDRKSDIPTLIEYLLGKINCELHRNIEKVEEKAIRRIMAYSWPGNVRELENVLTRAAIDTQGEVILEELITPLLGKEEAKKSTWEDVLTLQDVEKNHILRILTQTHWHYGETCKLLGISRPTLRQKLREYSIAPKAHTLTPGH